MAEHMRITERNAEKMGKHHAQLQLERPGVEEPLSDGTDIGFYETAV